MGAKDTSEAKYSSRPSIPRIRQEREQRGWTQSEVAERIGSTRINVSRWENGITVPGLYYRQRLGELFGKSLLELGLIPERSEAQLEKVDTSLDADLHTSSPALSTWNVPYRRNPFFTGREVILDHLYTVLRSRNSAALTQGQALSGLGGIGKTQIAVEYAYRYRDHYQAIFWINASSREVLSADFAAIAAWLDLPEQHEQDQDIVVRAVKRWLTTHTRWLLILDNVDEPEMIVDFLPVHTTGDVLLTTRLQALGTVAQSIEVWCFSCVVPGYWPRMHLLIRQQKRTSHWQLKSLPSWMDCHSPLIRLVRILKRRAAGCLNTSISIVHVARNYYCDEEDLQLIIPIRSLPPGHSPFSM